jgi:hypothetical protein
MCCAIPFNVLQCLEQFGQLECWQQVMDRLHPPPKHRLSSASIAGIAAAGACRLVFTQKKVLCLVMHLCLVLHTRLAVQHAYTVQWLRRLASWLLCVGLRCSSGL